MADDDNKSGQEKSFTRLHDIRGGKGSIHSRRRVGRGAGSGLGKTSGRGQKGAKSRSGYSRKIGFEGGQMPLQRRLPKRGFNNRFGKEFSIVNVGRLAILEPGAAIDALTLKAVGLVRKIAKDGVKLLGSGDISKALHMKVQGCTISARQKIEEAGGTVEIVAFKNGSEEQGE